jgi:hypothetical protein
LEKGSGGSNSVSDLEYNHSNDSHLVNDDGDKDDSDGDNDEINASESSVVQLVQRQSL